MTALRQLLVASAIGCAWFTSAQALPASSFDTPAVTFESHAALM